MIGSNSRGNGLKVEPFSNFSAADDNDGIHGRPGSAKTSFASLSLSDEKDSGFISMDDLTLFTSLAKLKSPFKPNTEIPQVKPSVFHSHSLFSPSFPHHEVPQPKHIPIDHRRSPSLFSQTPLITPPVNSSWAETMSSYPQRTTIQPRFHRRTQTQASPEAVIQIRSVNHSRSKSDFKAPVEVDSFDSAAPKHVLLFKTELCRAYARGGVCKYGDSCHFAHGVAELRRAKRHPKYKTERCKVFHEQGHCSFGPQCAFIHEENETQLKAIHVNLYLADADDVPVHESSIGVHTNPLNVQAISRPHRSGISD